MPAPQVVAAVQALNGATVSITPSPASGLKAGETQTLTASITGLATGRSVASYAWTITDGGGIVSAFASGATSATATLVPSAAGTFTVTVTLTDDLGQTYAQSQSVSVAAAPVVTPPSTNTGGGGGGTSQPVWLALLLLAVAALPRKLLGSAARG